MTIANRSIMFQQEEAGWKNPYVTDGLIAMWDGEWNAGGGVHDANATVWKDLSGNGHNLECRLIPSWSSDACVIRSLDNVFHNSDSSWFRDAWEGQGGAMVEIVLSYSDANGCAFGFGGQDNTWQAWAFGRMGYNDQNAYSVWRRGYVSQFGPWLYLSSESWKIAAWANQSDIKVWNMSSSNTGNYTYQAYTGNNLVIGASGIYGNLLKADYQSIRVYSHMLSEAENSANYAVDAKRFNLTGGGA